MNCRSETYFIVKIHKDSESSSGYKMGVSYSDNVVKEARKNTLELESLVMSSCKVTNNTKAKCNLKVLCPILDLFSV